MAASPEFTALFLRGLAWDAEQSGRSLVDVLEIASRGQLVDTPHGKVLAGTAADGATVLFTLPPRGQLRGSDVANVAKALLSRIQALRATSPFLSDGALCVALAPARTRGNGSRRGNRSCAKQGLEKAPVCEIRVNALSAA